MEREYVSIDVTKVDIAAKEVGKLAAANGALCWTKDEDKSCSKLTKLTIGVGAGSTVAIYMEHLPTFLQSFNCVASSYQARQLALNSHGTLLHYDTIKNIDFSVDGADELQVLTQTEDHLRIAMIKGGGACLLGEKVLNAASRKSIWLVDKEKISAKLGKRSFPVPVEVAPFAVIVVINSLEQVFGAQAQITVRQCSSGKAGPIITDNGNMILDIKIAPHSPFWDDLDKLCDIFNRTPGVVEHGIFICDAEAVFVGYNDGHCMVINALNKLY
jgi:ribose 5-phosphate isomerase A